MTLLNTANKIYRAGTPANRVYLAGVKVWPGGSFVSFDPVTAENVNLTGNDLIITNTASGITSSGARVAAAAGKTSGKYYYEVTQTNWATGGVIMLGGVGTIGSLFSEIQGNGTTGVMVTSQGQIWSVGGVPGNIGFRTNGDKIGFAIDLDNRMFWCRLVVPSVGSWNGNGSADPATNVGGITIPAGTMVPFCTFGGASTGPGNVVTTNFGASVLAGAVPGGFIAGWPVGPFVAPPILPLDGLSSTAAWSAGRKLLSSFGGSNYTAASGLVSVFNDQSGAARNLVASGSERPVIGSFGSVPAMIFDGVNAQFYNTGVPILSLVGNATGYMIMSFRATTLRGTGVGWQAVPLLNSSDNNAGMHVSNAGGGTFYADTWDGGGPHADRPIVVNTTYVGEWRHEGGLLYARINGGTESSVSAGNTIPSNYVRLGHWDYVGYIFEAATFTTIPTLAQRNALVQAFGLWAGASV